MLAHHVFPRLEAWQSGEDFLQCTKGYETKSVLFLAEKFYKGYGHSKNDDKKAGRARLLVLAYRIFPHRQARHNGEVHSEQFPMVKQKRE